VRLHGCDLWLHRDLQRERDPEADFCSMVLFHAFAHAGSLREGRAQPLVVDAGAFGEATGPLSRCLAQSQTVQREQSGLTDALTDRPALGCYSLQCTSATTVSILLDGVPPLRRCAH
jgi:hypothetical protein